MTHPKSRERGFTLIEMLVVVAILFIAVMLAAPYLNKQMQRSKLVGVANQALGTMRQARLSAIKSSRFGFVAINQPRLGVVGAFADTSAPIGALDVGDQLIGAVELPKGVQSKMSGFTGGVATFLSDGSIQNKGFLHLEAPEMGGGFHCVQIAVEPAATARAQIRKWNGSIWHTNGDPTPWDWTPVGVCP